MTIKVGSDFSGVGAFNQALMRLGIDYDSQAYKQAGNSIVVNVLAKIIKNLNI